MKYPRTDLNHAEIMSALRQAHCSVFDTSAAGRGFPDLVVAGRAACPYCRARFTQNLLVEVKHGSQLTPAQIKFAREWRSPVYVANSIDEALRLVGVKA